MNANEEAVTEELLPYKELFTTVVLQQDHEAAATSCFVFTAAGNLVTEDSCANIMNCNAKATNSIAKPAKLIANGMNSTAKVTNSTTNGTKSIAKVHLQNPVIIYNLYA